MPKREDDALLVLDMPLDSVTSLRRGGSSRVVSPQNDTSNTMSLPPHLLIPFNMRHWSDKDVRLLLTVMAHRTDAQEPTLRWALRYALPQSAHDLKSVSQNGR